MHTIGPANRPPQGEASRYRGTDASHREDEKSDEIELPCDEIPVSSNLNLRRAADADDDGKYIYIYIYQYLRFLKNFGTKIFNFCSLVYLL